MENHWNSLSRMWRLVPWLWTLFYIHIFPQAQWFDLNGYLGCKVLGNTLTETSLTFNTHGNDATSGAQASSCFSTWLTHVFISIGNNKLGGQDFTQRLLQFSMERVRQQYGVPPTLKEDIHLLRQAVEAAKLNLTQDSQVHLRVPLHLQTTGENGAREEKVLFQEKLTRELFEELNADLFQKILAPIETVLIEGHLEKEEVDEIVLVGGSTRIPRIRQLISQYFGKDPNTSVDPDLAVVTGVAIQAGIMGGSWPLQVSAIEIPNRHLRKTNFSWLVERLELLLGHLSHDWSVPTSQKLVKRHV